MEVDLAWLEQEPSDTAKGAAVKAPASRRETLEVRLEWLEQESGEGAAARRKSSASVPVTRSKRVRQPWEPPTLPPPAASAAKPKRALPPPLPREEPEEEPVRRGSTAPKR